MLLMRHQIRPNPIPNPALQGIQRKNAPDDLVRLACSFWQDGSITRQNKQKHSGSKDAPALSIFWVIVDSRTRFGPVSFLEASLALLAISNDLSRSLGSLQVDET
jgi:hypothetical protein